MIRKSAPFLALIVAPLLLCSMPAGRVLGAPANASKLVRFPDRAMLGNLYWLPPEMPVWTNQYLTLRNPPYISAGKARGTVRVPQQANLFLDVSYEAAHSPTLLTALGPAFFTGLRFSEVEADNGTISMISKLSGLRALSLIDVDMTDQGMQSLCKLQKLEYLRIVTAPITDAGLSSLSRLQSLKSLQFSCTQIAGPALKEIGLCKQLRVLAFSHSKVGNDSLHFLSSLPELETLELSTSPGITAKGLMQLTGLKSLKRLELFNSGINAADLPTIKEVCRRMPSLQHLSVRDKSFTDVAAQKWKHSLPKLDLSLSPAQEDEHSPLPESDIPQIFGPIH